MCPNSFRSFALIVLLFLASCTLAAAGSQDRVTWMHADFAPLRIIDGPYAGQGPSDMLHGLMRREMPGLDHSVLTANMSRTLNWMKNGENVLAVGLIPSPERVASMQFSVPCVMVPPACLVVRAGDRERFGGDRLSLREFVPARRLGVAAARSYGPEVDAVLRDAAGSPRIVVHSGSDLLGSLMEMLLLDRVDGVLAFPFEAVYVARMNGKEDRIALVPLKEALVPVYGRVAAPRTSWGTAMLARVDEILLRHRGEPEYRAAFERWLRPEDVEGYRAMYESFLRSR